MSLTSDQQLKQLRCLLEEGIISQDDFLIAKAQIEEGSAKKIVEEEEPSYRIVFTEEQLKQLVKLRKLMNKKVITQDDYNAAVAKMEQEAIYNNQVVYLQPQEESFQQDDEVPKDERIETIPDQPDEGEDQIQEASNILNTEHITDNKNMLFNEEELKQLEKLQRLLLKGVITQHDYDSKYNQMKHIAKARSTPIEVTQPISITPKLPLESPNTTSPPSSPTKSWTVAKLQKLLQKGIINQNEYEYKCKQLQEQSPTKEQQTLIEKLQLLLNKGIINQTEYDKKKQDILSQAHKKSTNQTVTKQLTEEQKKTLTTLKLLLDKGIITETEYETKRAALSEKLSSPVMRFNSPSGGSSNVTLMLKAATLQKLQDQADVGIITREEFEEKREKMYEETQGLKDFKLV
jgi:hypothetical protein